jgi:Ring finger domain
VQGKPLVLLLLIVSLDRFTVAYPPSSLSYGQVISDGQSLVNTPNLAPNYAGLLYFPANPRNCSDPSVPNNGIPPDGVTIDHLPVGFNLIAMIPITACTSEYLMQAKRDQAEAAILYNYTSTSNMPPSSSLTNTFNLFNNPIYGITSNDATPLLQNMVSYSGNMSSVPFGRNLTALYDPLDYVRLTLTIDTGEGSSLPGLWLFLLVILAALGLIIASTSISMHISQYRARRDLRRRIAAGEIDLETLGIKRLTVPKEMIDAMPIKIYGAARSKFAPPLNTDTRQTSSSPSPSSGSEHNPINSSLEVTQEIRPTPGDSFEQQSCAICLDDFVVNTTPVRHLPCNHIYHPHCIDPFLSTRSSLCPLCKQSVLPKGFVPPTLQLTNATVARERRLRLLRERNHTRNTDPRTLEGGIEMANTGGNSAAAAASAPTQEEEDAEIRRRPLFKRIIESVFPRFRSARTF